MTRTLYSIHVEQPPLARLSATAARQPAAGWPVVLGIALCAVAGGLLIAFAGENALYLMLALIGSAFILFDYRIGVVLLILLFPVSRSALFPHALMGVTGLNPLNVLMVATLVAALLRVLPDGAWRRLLPAPLVALYLLPLTVAAVLGVRHVDEMIAVTVTEHVELLNTPGTYLREMLFKPAMLPVFALLVAAAVAQSGRVERFLAPAVVSIWVMGAMVVVYFLQSGVSLGVLAGASERGFLSELGMHANELGRLYAVAYALLLYMLAATGSPGLRLVLLASIAVVVAALVLTFSRSAFLALVIVTALFFAERLSVRTLAFAAVLAIVAVVAIPAAVVDRATAGFGQGWDAITAGRLDGLWLPLWPEMLQTPPWGRGHGSILWSEAMHNGTILATTHPHSAYLEAWTDLGPVGLALVLGYFFHAWRGLRRLGRDAALSGPLRGFFQGAAAGLLCFLLIGVVDSSLMPKPEQAFLWLAIGLMYGVRAGRDTP